MFIDNVQLNPDLVINRNGKIRKRKRINNWQAEDDEKMKSSVKKKAKALSVEESVATC